MGLVSRFTFAIEISIGSSSGGGRAADHDCALSFDGAYTVDGAAEDVIIVHNGHEQHPEGAGFTQHCGDFTPPGRAADLPWGGNFVSGSYDTNCGTTAARDIENTILLDNPELQAGILPTVTAPFRIEQGAIEVFDKNTGRYITGPADNFTFNLLLNP